jgi:hypothetical protein
MSSWSKTKPNHRERTIMQQDCGQKCFLGSKKSFPICDKGTCNINENGIKSAYIRAREFGSVNRKKTSRKHGKSYYRNIAKKSKRMLLLRGYKTKGTRKH